MNEPKQGAKTPRDRSPSFPFIPLRTAIERLIAFEEYFKRHPAPVRKAGLAWKMKGYTSQAQQTLAALRAFGLTTSQRSENGTLVMISDEGRTYLRAQQDDIKREVLKRAALKPKQIEKHWRQWGADRPPDPVALDSLVLHEGFTQDGAEKFLKVYDATLAYAGLASSDKIEPVAEAEIVAEIPSTQVEIGDLIQVEIDGALQLEKPKRVRAIREHEGQAWVFIEGSETGIPMEQARVEQKGQAGNKPPITPPILPEGNPPKPGARTEVTSLDEGPATLTWPENLSPESYADLEHWLKGILHKAKRRAGVKGSGGGAGPN